MARLSLPTTARLPSSLRVDPTNKSVIKALSRLSRSSLLSLVLDWLDDRNQLLCPPLLRRSEDEEEDEDDFYPPARELPELRDVYATMRERRGGRREVVDRVLEGDWRYGVSLYQLAMADLQHLYDHPGSLKWTAYRIQRLRAPAHEDDVDDDHAAADRPDRESLAVPRFHPPTFLQNLQAEVLPDVKAHYNFDRPKGLPLLLLRIFIIDSPYNTDLAVSSRHRGRGAASNAYHASTTTTTTTSFDAARTIYVAFPDASPHIFIAKSASTLLSASASASAAATSTASAATSAAAGEAKSLRALIVEGIPKALSRPRERYALKATDLSTKNLGALLAAKGPGRGGAAAGGWGAYAGVARGDVAADSPLQSVLPTPPLSDASHPDEGAGGAPRDAGRSRYGNSDSGSGSGSGSGAASRDGSARKRGRPPRDEDGRQAKRARTAAQARFGDAARPGDGKGVESLDVALEDEFPSADPSTDGGSGGDDAASRERDLQKKKKRAGGRRSTIDFSGLRRYDEEEEAEEEEEGGERGAGWAPRVRLSFRGPHVFAGVRQLVEAGVVDAGRMPGWLTGEEGVTAGTVRGGRIRGFRGSGV
ncbi:CHL4-domain-containing protein [Durotheca rogersii]|uniref:CHL4-domain-containing protein n=1 Tax=Durotheca rogersii TaxID=419775 RepID=UPI00221FF6ED|nr:CHL4-domain-containing protein [Durotheca rogersii]KAI5864073.1 CHL4-domain-containing protein [Durotheca rogersii]